LSHRRRYVPPLLRRKFSPSHVVLPWMCARASRQAFDIITGKQLRQTFMVSSPDKPAATP
jgi:hypothetical protein